MIDQLALKEGRCARPVFGVEPIQFHRRHSRRHHERFAVGERAAFGRLGELAEFHSWFRLERAHQFKSLAVLATKAHRKNFADAEGDEVVEDRARGAGLRANVDDVVNGQAGFERSLLFARINLEITIETEVADDRDAQGSIARGDLLEAGEVHREEKHQTPLRKTPNTKIQTPNKHQAPITKAPAALDFWCLRFLWGLGFGVWGLLTFCSCA